MSNNLTWPIRDYTNSSAVGGHHRPEHTYLRRSLLGATNQEVDRQHCGLSTVWRLDASPVICNL